jgi:microcystin-dependent protein
MGIINSGGGEAVGTWKFWPSTTVPAGWIKANGAAISRTTYAALFNVIGTTYGVGNGSTTFNLPDFRGEFVRGLDDGRGVDTGRAMGSAQAEDIKTHTHSLSAAMGLGSLDASGADTVGFGSGGGSGVTNATGGTETRPRNIAQLVIMKF